MTDFAQLPDFDSPNLAAAVEQLDEAAIDALPFGVIRLDTKGVVRLFSQTERRLSGYGKRPGVGHDFFATIAPCMDNDHFRGRIDRARAAGTLDLEFTHIGDFNDENRELTVRIQSASDRGTWIFLRRES